MGQSPLPDFNLSSDLSLPELCGTLVSNVNNSSNVWEKSYAVIKNKKFKYYYDKDMRKLEGVFDFDKI